MALYFTGGGGGMSTEKTPSGISGNPYTWAVTTATWWQCTSSGEAMTKAKRAQFSLGVEFMKPQLGVVRAG